MRVHLIHIAQKDKYCKISIKTTKHMWVLGIRGIESHIFNTTKC